MDTCPTCGRPVRLVRLGSRVLAIEPRPHPHGTVQVGPDGAATVPPWWDRLPGLPLHRAHLPQLCPYAPPGRVRWTW